MNGRTSVAGRGIAPDVSEEVVLHPPKRRVGRAERMVTELFSAADIEVNGSRPCDIQVNDERFFRRVLKDGTLGFGESYMLWWWDCDDLEELCHRAIRAGLEHKVPTNAWALIEIAFGMVLSLQSKSRSKVVARRHYDLGNDFFGAMLDPAMQYSCAYFHGTADLATAQQLKMELICKKLALQPGMRLLDIGCGWGGLARFAAENHGCEVVGITISEQQKEYADSHCMYLRVEILLQDYRDVDGEYDAICSVGMLEHVGRRNYDAYMDAAYGCLKEGGLFLCHTITTNESRRRPDPWISKYIFMNSELPTAAQVLQAAEEYFVNEDMHNLGPYYVPTLRAWEAGFMKSREDFRIEFGEQFVRMWRLYLLSCSGAFRARRLQVIQFLFSKGGIETPEPVRIN